MARIFFPPRDAVGSIFVDETSIASDFMRPMDGSDPPLIAGDRSLMHRPPPLPPESVSGKDEGELPAPVVMSVTSCTTKKFGPQLYVTPNGKFVYFKQNKLEQVSVKATTVFATDDFMRLIHRAQQNGH